MIKIILVGLGGFLGAISRYLIGKAIVTLFPDTLFPYSTLVVNLLGCLLFGILLVLAEYKQMLSPEISLFLLVGFIGALTTFSAYSFDSLYLIRNNHICILLLNIALQTSLGIFSVWVGYLLGMQLFK